jgi:pimeloyl-ACP methyl ester carboxylesterase
MSPSILLIGGWEAFDPSLLDSPAITELSQRLNAKVVGLEHRFFGQSRFSSATFNFLSVRQAIADVAAIVESITSECSLDRCRLVVVGVGTGGAIASWFHQKYAGLSTTGAWIASAPIAAAVELPSVDALVGKRLREIDEGCPERIRELLAGGGTDEELAGFNLTNESMDSFAKIASDVIERVALNGSLVSELRSVCSVPTISSLAQFVGRVLPRLGIPSARSLDPLLTPEDAFAEDARAALWLQCQDVGWFRTAANDGARPLSINVSYYSGLCSKVFGSGLPRVSAFNLEFGGRIPRTKSVIFSGGANDTFAAVAADPKVSGRVNETFYIDLGAARDTDSLSDSALAQTRQDRIFAPINAWVNFSCLKCNQTYGECYLHSCICAEGWGTAENADEECGGRQVAHEDMLVVEVLATIMPTILVLTIGFVTWGVLIQSKGNASPDGSGTTGKRWSGTGRLSILF